MGRGKGLFSLFPLPIVPRALSFSFSPVSLRHKEASAEEGGVRLRELTVLAGNPSLRLTISPFGEYREKPRASGT